MAEGDVSSGIKIEVSSSKSSLFTTLRSSKVARTWSSNYFLSKPTTNERLFEVRSSISLEIESSDLASDSLTSCP